MAFISTKQYYLQGCRDGFHFTKSAAVRAPLVAGVDQQAYTEKFDPVMAQRTRTQIARLLANIAKTQLLWARKQPDRRQLIQWSNLVFHILNQSIPMMHLTRKGIDLLDQALNYVSPQSLFLDDYGYGLRGLYKTLTALQQEVNPRQSPMGPDYRGKHENGLHD